MSTTQPEAKDKTKSRIRGLLNEAKLNALFDALSDQTLEDVLKISFASRSANSSGKNLNEKKLLANIMPAELRSQLKERFNIDIANDGARVTIGEQLFSRLGKYLARHPERLTIGIYDELVERKDFHYIVSLVQKKTAADGTVMLIPTKTALSQGNAITAERIINIENKGIAKVEMLFDLITKRKAEEANLGGISKALRDILAALHMMRLDFTPEQAMESTFKETSTSDDGKTIRESVVRYTKKSAETWASKK